MGWFNKLCEYMKNEEGFKSGFVCTITGRHIGSNLQGLLRHLRRAA